MSATLHVWPQPRVSAGGFVRESARVEFPGGEVQELWLEVPVEFESKLSDRHDHFLLGVIFRAMQEADTCHVHGTVTRSLLSNVEEFNAVWNAWDPKRYRRVKLMADTAASSSLREGMSAVLAYSGGVDACASLFRHHSGRVNWRRRDIRAGMLVQGFDIPLNETAAFERARSRAAALLGPLGLEVIPVRTNLKQHDRDWEMAFAAILSACLALLSGGYGSGLMGSDEPFTDPVPLWGSNPVSNPFLGSSFFEIVTDGAELTRLEKVRLLGGWPEGVASLRVCWEGPITGSNCGVCEKCVRTRLELVVCGINEPDPFPIPLLPEHLKKISPRNPYQLTHLKHIVDEGDRIGLDAWWMPELRRIVRAGVTKPSKARAFAKKVVPPGVRPIVKKLIPGAR